MNLGSQVLVSKQSMMPSSSGAGARDADGNGSDQFPAGLRVLVVDDDPTCLMILEKMLRNCNYEVTKCNRAEVALSLLRENKNGYDVVISDVHMPDMDGFKLLVHIGLEMDLPVIMMSADDSKSVVMKGVTHGACDYLIKPVRMEALRNIWQHVVRKRKHEWKDIEPSSASLDEGDRQHKKQPEDPDYTSSANEGHNCKNTKKRKDDEDEAEEKEHSSSSSLKKPRVAWSMELHQQFVAAVNQLGFDKAVPKKILDLMNVPGITRENVASHLQKYRIYLRKLGGPQQPGVINPSFMGNLDAGYGPLNELNLQALAASGQLNQLPAQSLASLQAVGLGRSANSRSAPLIDQRNIFSFENPKLRYGQVQNRHGHNSNISKQMNLLHGVPTTMEPKQLAGFRHSFSGMTSQGLIPMTGQSQSQSHDHLSRRPVLSNGMVGNMRDTATAMYNPQTASLAQSSGLTTSNSFPLRGSLVIPSIMSTSTLQRDGNIENVQNRPQNWGLQGVDLAPNPRQHTNNMQGGLNVLHHNNYNSDQNTGGSKVIVSSGEGSWTHITEDPSPVNQPFGSEEYNPEDILTPFLTQQEGAGQAENEFGFDWYSSSDNLPV